MLLYYLNEWLQTKKINLFKVFEMGFRLALRFDFVPEYLVYLLANGLLRIAVSGIVVLVVRTR